MPRQIVFENVLRDDSVAQEMLFFLHSTFSKHYRETLVVSIRPILTEIWIFWKKNSLFTFYIDNHDYNWQNLIFLDSEKFHWLHWSCSQTEYAVQCYSLTEKMIHVQCAEPQQIFKVDKINSVQVQPSFSHFQFKLCIFHSWQFHVLFSLY